MSDVKDQLYDIMKRSHGEFGDYKNLVNAILARYDVTPKSAIGPTPLGVLVADSHNCGEPSFEEQGKNMIERLASVGYQIVRIEETTP